MQQPCVVELKSRDLLVLRASQYVAAPCGITPGVHYRLQNRANEEFMTENATTKEAVSAAFSCKTDRDQNAQTFFFAEQTGGAFHIWRINSAAFAYLTTNDNGVCPTRTNNAGE